MLKEENKSNSNEILNKPLDIETYYKENEKLDTKERNIALQIITENQNIGCHVEGKYRHEQLLQIMHEYIYDGIPNKPKYIEGNHFEQYSKNNNCIIIRYLEPMNLPLVYIHMPEEINKFQKEEIIKVYKQIAKINEQRKEDRKIKTCGIKYFPKETVVNPNYVNMLDILLTPKNPYKR